MNVRRYGDPVVTVRLPAALILAMDTARIDRNRRSDEAEMNFSDFIRLAIQEKLAKMQRSRTWRQRKKALAAAHLDDGEQQHERNNEDGCPKRDQVQPDATVKESEA